MELKAVVVLLLSCTALCLGDDCTTKTNWCDCLNSNCGWCTQEGFRGTSKCDSPNELIRRGCGQTHILRENLQDRCIKPGQDPRSLVCSGRGHCDCGRCACNGRQNPAEVVSGTYCECDNYSCDRGNGLLCSGHGECVCGKCVCADGWTDRDCFRSTRAPPPEVVHVVPEASAAGEHYSMPDDGMAIGERRKCTLYEAASKIHSRICGIRHSAVCEPNGECDRKEGQCACKEGYFGKYCRDCLTEECRGHCNDYKTCVECKYRRTSRISQQECDTLCQYVSIAGVSTQDYEKPLPINSRRCSYVDDWRRTVRFSYTVDSWTRNPFVKVETTDTRYSDVIVEPDCEVVKAEEIKAPPEDIKLPEPTQPETQKPDAGQPSGNENANQKVEPDAKPGSGISLLPSVMLSCLSVLGALLLR